MTVKSLQLKKFGVKELKQIVKKYKLGKITKKKKTQLIGMIQSADNLKEILSSLTLPIKKKRVFSEKQLAAQKNFANRNYKKVKPSKELPVKVEKQTTKLPTMSERSSKSIKLDRAKISKQEHEINYQKNKKKKQTKKDFLDEIFGFKEFNFENEIIKIINNVNDEIKLNNFLKLPKKEIHTLLKKKYDDAMSVKQFIKRM